MARSFEIWCACPGCGHSTYHLLERVDPAPPPPAGQPPAWAYSAHDFDDNAPNIRRCWFKRECRQCGKRWKEQEPHPARAWLSTK